MKKIISILLSLIILASMCTFAFAAEGESDLDFAVASDLHVVPPEETLEKTNDDPIFWYANRRASMDNESGFILDSFLKQCAEDDGVDFVLIPGDLTDGGRHFGEQHDYVVQKFINFEKETGKQIYVIDGNHDLGTSENSDFTIADFKTVYNQFGYDEALSIREDDCSYTVNLGEKYRLIALDSCNPEKSTADGMTDDKIEWVVNEAAKAKADGKYPILMMHHNLLEHMPMQPILSKNFIVKNHISTAEKFANAGIKLVFSGHEHCSDATSYISSKGNIISDFATTALSMYPITYRVFSMTEDEIKYQSKEVEKIDTEALNEAVEGYTPEILEAMNKNLNEFAKGYLKAGVQYRLALSLSAEKLGIDENAFYYDFVMKVVTRLTDILEMPLYGENSVQSLAKQYNLEIPDTNYKNGWDLATEIVSTHYAGNEVLTLDSDEVTILLRTVAFILREEFYLIKDELFLSAASDIFKNLGFDSADEVFEKFGKSGYDKITAVEYLLLAIASPILYEFALDTDTVDDNNGVIEGYGVGEINNKANISNKVSIFFEKVIIYLKMIINYLSKIFANY